MKKFRSCPFCGSDNDEHEIIRDPVLKGESSTFTAHYVSCGTCEAVGPAGDSDDEAIALWNNRNAPEQWEPLCCYQWLLPSGAIATCQCTAYHDGPHQYVDPIDRYEGKEVNHCCSIYTLNDSQLSSLLAFYENKISETIVLVLAPDGEIYSEDETT